MSVAVERLCSRGQSARKEKLSASRRSFVLPRRRQRNSRQGKEPFQPIGPRLGQKPQHRRSQEIFRAIANLTLL